jgi:hypothetical protein
MDNRAAWPWHLLLLCGALASGCVTAGREPIAPAVPLEVCSAVPVGTGCQLSIMEGSDPVTSRCTKQLDGSLVCDSPDLPGGGPRVSTRQEDGVR